LALAAAEGQSQGGMFFVKVDEAALRKRFFVRHDVPKADTVVLARFLA
jgi:hypothetical protein